MRFAIWPAVFLAAMLGACATSNQGASTPGADRDAHGCIPSAGYRWCTLTEQCERPWELADRVMIENTPEAFDAYCANPPE